MFRLVSYQGDGLRIYSGQPTSPIDQIGMVLAVLTSLVDALP